VAEVASRIADELSVAVVGSLLLGLLEEEPTKKESIGGLGAIAET